MTAKFLHFDFWIICILIVAITSCNNSPTTSTATDSTTNSTTKLTAAEAKSLAKDAYLFGMPVVFIQKQSDYQTHATKVEKTKAPINQFMHYRAFVDASDRSVVGFM